MKQHFDLVFVGSGLSCTYTIKHFLKLITKNSESKPPDILVIDKSDHFWTGTAYGERSGCTSLIITPLRNFLPECEREEFTNWLKANFSWIWGDLRDKSGAKSAAWLSRNETALANNDFENIYFPRYVIGLYLKEMITKLLEEAVIKGFITYKLIKAEVKTIQKADDYVITAFDDAQYKVQVTAEKIVFCVGNIHGPPLNNHKVDSVSSGTLFIENLYQPSITHNIENACRFLASRSPLNSKNILIIGSNASALEALYNMVEVAGFNQSTEKFYCISASGLFPGLIKEDSHLSSYLPSHLSSLRNSLSLTSEDIYVAIQKDINEALSTEIDIDETYYPISKIFGELIQKLDPIQKRMLVDKYGVEIGKFQRRAGAEYLNVVANLAKQGNLEIIKGRFLKYIIQEQGSIQFEYADGVTGEKRLHSNLFDVVINCSGFGSLKETQSQLMQNLILEKICKVNNSGKGISVNEKYEADRNFFVMGPLLAGNIIGENMIWHAESCQRIFSLSRELASFLL